MKDDQGNIVRFDDAAKSISAMTAATIRSLTAWV
jgi:hypothetical protein